MRNETPGEDSAAAIRRRLLEITDQLRSLDDSDLAVRYRLSTEADELRQQLWSLDTDDAGLRAEWAERAGRKGGHADTPAASRAGIVSPGEGGGSI